MMRRAPGFTAITLLSLGLGIGANTAIFSLVHTLMLRSLPVRDPQQLVELLNKYPGEPHVNGFSWQSYLHFRDHNHVLRALIGSSPAHLTVRAEGLDPEIVDGEYVVSSFFPVVARRIPEIGVRMALGAARGQVLCTVIYDALGMAAAGLAIGVPDALPWARRFAASLVPGLPLSIVFPITSSAVAMLAIALLAAWLPARRAACVDLGRKA